MHPLFFTSSSLLHCSPVLFSSPSLCLLLLCYSIQFFSLLLLTSSLVFPICLIWGCSCSFAVTSQLSIPNNSHTGKHLFSLSSLNNEKQALQRCCLRFLSSFPFQVHHLTCLQAKEHFYPILSLSLFLTFHPGPHWHWVAWHLIPWLGGQGWKNHSGCFIMCHQYPPNSPHSLLYLRDHWSFSNLPNHLSLHLQVFPLLWQSTVTAQCVIKIYNNVTFQMTAANAPGLLYCCTS